MKNLILGTSIISTTVGIISIQTAVQAAQLTGEFKWEVEPPKTEIFSGSGSFTINKDKKTGKVTFTVMGLPDPNPSPGTQKGSMFMFDITDSNITETEDDWKLNSFDFKAMLPSMSSGSLNFIMPNDKNDNGEVKEPFKSFFLQDDQEKIPLKITGLKTTHCGCDQSSNSISTYAQFKPFNYMTSIITAPFVLFLGEPAMAQSVNSCSPCDIPEPSTILGLATALSFGGLFQWNKSKKKNKAV